MELTQYCVKGQHRISGVNSSHFAAREFLLRFSKDYHTQIIFGDELMIQFLALALLFCVSSFGRYYVRFQHIHLTYLFSVRVIFHSTH
jgi:hypothetical protein